MGNASKFVKNGNSNHLSRLVKAMEDINNLPDSYIKKPDGVFGAVAKVICGNVTINSDDLDLEFTVPFDDDLEANEAEIIIYNLTQDTINQFKYHAVISIEAGYIGDTGVIFRGYIDRVKTSREGADKITTIRAFDDVSKKTVESISFAAGTKASYILKTLVNKTGIPIAVMKIRRDYTYKDETTVDGDLMENIKKYSEVCGVSTYVCKGKIYCRYIKDGDNINFTVSENTGMIGTPEEYQEEITAEDYKDTINGYEIEMLLQHRMQTAAIVNINSVYVNGKFRVRSGEHTFNDSGCITKIKVM